MENYCTLYAHKSCYEEIKEIVKQTLPKARITDTNTEGGKTMLVSRKKGIFGSRQFFQISYREREKLSYTIDSVTDALTRNLTGMIGYVDAIQTSNQEIQQLLIEKIRTINAEFPILHKGDMDDEIALVTEKISEALDTIAFVSPESPIGKSASQHFLNNNLELLLDADGVSKVSSLSIEIDAAYFDGNQEDITDEQKERKQTSEKILERLEIKTNQHLPCLPSEKEILFRTPKEIAERVVGLALTNIVAFNGISGEQAIAYAKKHGVYYVLTPNEIDFLTNPTEEKKHRESWKCEGIWVLMWALNIISDLGAMDQLVNLDEISEEAYPIGAEKDPNIFINRCLVLRDKNQILDMADLYYRADWACVDARIGENEIKSLNPGLVYERHYAFNWLIRYRDQEWDDVSCDT